MVKVALIGCGTMGRTHLAGYKKIENAQVTAVCDLEKEKAEKLVESGETGIYTDFDTMMEQAEFDVLDVCLPTYLHKQYAVKAMEAGKHVFCEKPIALTEEDAREMVETAKRCGVKFSVGHVLRFFPSYKNAAEQFADGRMGIPRLIRTIRNQAFPQWSWEGWYKDYEKSGGPIVDLVIHDFDWIIHNFGSVERVFAKSFNGTIKEQEHCMVILKLKNGAIAHVEGSWAYPAGSAFRMAFEVVGTEGQIEFDNLDSSPVIKQTNVDGIHHLDRYSPVPGKKEPYCAELNEFITCVEQDLPPVVTGEEAIEALRTALAALESSRTGKPVTL
ncbi:MAG: Gfo/Idh/MocA family oxidoreductase [Lachnospiraceae bacterium]|nr:Gfo/Idh/MocA family oxidoreductase [Lachnospiraceae bacterium]